MKSWRKYYGKITKGHGLALFALLVACLFTITVKGTDIAKLVAAATSSLSLPATLYFTPYTSSDLTVGDTTQVDVNVNARVPINAMGMNIKFSDDTIEIIGISKARSFLDLWTEETSIREDEGAVHFSAGTLQKGGLVGTGTAITLTLKAKKAGEAKLFFEDAQVYASDGRGTLVESAGLIQTFKIAERPQTTISISATTITPEAEGPTPPSADLDGNGVINFVDISILAVKMFVAYNPRYDLNMDGAVSIADISIIFSKM